MEAMGVSLLQQAMIEARFYCVENAPLVIVRSHGVVEHRFLVAPCQLAPYKEVYLERNGHGGPGDGSGPDSQC